MGYSTVTEVRAILRESAADQTEVETAITDADAWIDASLKHHESTLPLSPTPDAINRASKYYAANLWLLLSGKTSDVDRIMAKIYERLAKGFLDLHISESYYVGKMRSG